MVFGIFRGRPPAVEPVDLSGSVALVTGASAGIGVETARYLARWGAHVILVGRDPARTRAAAADVAAGARGTAEAVLADFASLAAVRALAADVLGKHPRLDLLINNAGLWLKGHETTADGFEKTFAVNHLAPFLLTRLLSERLVASRGRVVNVSSRLHDSAPAPDAGVLVAPPQYNGIRAYASSKLCNVLFSRELAERLRDAGVRSNAVHPGDVATDVTRDDRVLAFLSSKFGGPFLLTPEEGARTSVHVATSPSLGELTGRYFVNCREAPASPHAEDAALRRALWTESERLVGLSPS